MLRRATLDDTAHITRLEARAAFHPWSEASVHAMLALPTTRAWLFGSDGYLVATVVSDVGELLTVGVNPEARRQGIGHALMGQLEDCWREEAVNTGFLEVRADNGPARALYARRGWRQTGTRVDYYGPGRDAVQMCWEQL